MSRLRSEPLNAVSLLEFAALQGTESQSVCARYLLIRTNAAEDWTPLSASRGTSPEASRLTEEGQPAKPAQLRYVWEKRGHFALSLVEGVVLRMEVSAPPSLAAMHRGGTADMQAGESVLPGFPRSP